MNPEKTKITGMIAAFDNTILNARFEYEIDLTTNKVTYVITCHWKARTRNSRNGVFGSCPFKKHSEAALFFDGIVKYANAEAAKEAA